MIVIRRSIQLVAHEIKECLSARMYVRPDLLVLRIFRVFGALSDHLLYCPGEAACRFADLGRAQYVDRLLRHPHPVKDLPCPGLPLFVSQVVVMPVHRDSFCFLHRRQKFDEVSETLATARLGKFTSTAARLAAFQGVSCRALGQYRHEPAEQDADERRKRCPHNVRL